MLIQQIMHGTPEQKAAAQKELDLMKQYSTSNFDALGAEMAKAMQGIR